jgi:L-seryl-tRNA(Ser) seleniumtransferase
MAVRTSPGQARELPAVDQVLRQARVQVLLGRFRRELVVRCCREVLDERRRALRADDPQGRLLTDTASIVSEMEHRLEARRGAGLTRVINATGTLLHTNLGRAPLPRRAIDAVQCAAGEAVDLEYDLARGERGRREDRLEALLTELTGAEAATVVNNNAAAVLLALNTLAAGKEVIVSRGELIEIGGSFRIPDIMERSGAVLREVGTTNRTHPADYETAISDRTALILKVQTSNYRVVGFVADVPLPELVAIGRARGLPVMEDLGSGALVDLAAYGLPREPVAGERVRLGADVVTFSGDKVLGGPQAGLIVGCERWIREMQRNPLHRALRCGKLTIAALEATLKVYQESPDVIADIPALKMFARPVLELEGIASAALARLATALGPDFDLAVTDTTSQIGSGALPTEEIASKAIVVSHPQRSTSAIAELFRRAKPPIIGRVHGGRFLLDVRAVFSPDDLVPHWS